MNRSRLITILGLVALVAVALIVMAALNPPGPQSASGSADVLATPIPLPGQEAMTSPLPAPTWESRAIYVADNPLQSPLETPMP